MKSCKQCGTCCRKGGPSLHKNDIHLVTDGCLPITNLVCIREGEPVFSPLNDRIEPAEVEIIKISATNSWCCPFLQANKNQCSIYQHRPTECQLLKCWDTTEIFNAIYRDVVNRFDLIPTNHAIRETLETHNKECSFSTMQEIAEGNNKGRDSTSQEKFQEIITRDLAIREKAINTFHLSLPEELFYFGRPMFKSLDFFNK